MGKSKKNKTKVRTMEVKGHSFADEFLENSKNIPKDIPKDEIFPLPHEDQEADHVVDGYKMHDLNTNEYFNDDLGVDNQDYEVEQERYAVQREDAQPIAVDRYFERFGKNRRTPR
jgi:hypothetical protein